MNRKVFKYIFLLLALLFGSSCTSVMTRSKMSPEVRYRENFIFYTGTRLNYEVVSNKSEKKRFLRYAFGIPDIPLSFIADTVFIPLDLVVLAKGAEKGSQPDDNFEGIRLLVSNMVKSLNEKGREHFVNNFVDKEEVQTSLFDMNLKELNQEDAHTLLKTLGAFQHSGAERITYERNGRHFIKGEDFLLSFRKKENGWVLSSCQVD